MRRSLALWLLAGFLSSLYAADGAKTDAKDPNTLSNTLSLYSADLSMPDTPGLSIVGLSSQNILRPTSPRALGLAALQGRNDDGTAKQGFALDAAPMKLIEPGMTKQQYADRGWNRLLWNTQLSLGVGQPLSDKDKSTRIGMGLSSVLWRNKASDPLRDEKHGECLQDALKLALPAKFPGVQDGQNNDGKKPADSAAQEAASKAIKNCQDQLAERTWNSSALMVGLATTSVSGRDPAVLPDARPRGFWTSFNYGFEGTSLQPTLQFTAGYRRLKEEIITDPADKTKFVARDSQLVGAKLYGRHSLANLFIEVSRRNSTIEDRATEHANLFVFGAEKKISDNLWLTVSMGTNRGGTTANPTYVSTGLKFGYENAASIK